MSGTKILVIEDDANIRESIVDTLMFSGYDVYEAPNGRLGVTQAKRILPDLIICDVMMPELDGYGVLLELSYHVALSSTPFIFLTAKATHDDWRKGMDLGADDYIIKPFKSQTLLDAVEARLSRQKAVAGPHAEKLEHIQRYINLHLPHELRTPLTGVRGYLSLLKSDIDSFEPEQVQLIIDSADRSAERLYDLVESYIAYSQLQTLLANKNVFGQLRQYSLLRNPSSLIEVAAQKAAHAQKRYSDLNNQIEDAPIVMYQDHLNKMVFELVKNACLFSEKESPIQVFAGREDDAYVIRIHNNGRGMTPEQINSIGPNLQFDRHIYEQQGVGLGLAIARDIALLYSGRLEIESVEGESLTVVVTLPIAADLANIFIS